MADNYGEILIYQTEDGVTNIEVKMQDETVWLTQQQLAELYQSSKSNISEHIKHIFEEGELDEKAVVRKFRTTASDGKNYNMTYYNLDMIISLGYRIKSLIATSVDYDPKSDESIFFLRLFKISCIMQHMGILPRKLFMNVLTLRSLLWD